MSSKEQYLKDAEYWEICASVCITDIETKARCLGNMIYCLKLNERMVDVEARKAGLAEYKLNGGKDW